MNYPDVLVSFTAEASRNPAAIAVEVGEQQISYSLLDRVSSAVSSILRARGCRPGHLVPVLVDRSAGWPVAVLGVLKAGCAFIPIDPGWPTSRQEDVITRSGARTVVSTAIDLHNPDACVVSRPSDIPPGELHWPEPPAYAICTSGTEGTPKIALNSRRGLNHLVHCLRTQVCAPSGARWRVCLTAGVGFDPWIQQMFFGLTGGHTLVIVPEAVRRDGRLFARFLIDLRIDLADATPSQLRMLSQPGHSVTGALPVRQLLVGGEKLLSADVRRLYERFPGSDFVVTNIYGLAECAVDSAAFTFDRTSIPDTEVIPIGTPLGDTTMRVGSGHEQDNGAVAELIIGGPGVGLGYLGSDAAAVGSDVRLREFRSGDLVRVNERGIFSVLGRVSEDQVKISGQRASLAEIESSIRKYNPLQELQRPAWQSSRLCSHCLLSGAHPGVTIDAGGVCSVCREWERWAPRAERYFRTEDDLMKELSEVRKDSGSPYDVLLLFSGGKDSTYVLHRLVDLGLRVHSFTFDNGFISQLAFRNIEQTTKALGVRHITMTTAHMQQIFRESLATTSTVCEGCFRALTTHSTQFAAAQGIDVVMTGLSRGQILETKLSQLLRDGIFDAAAIDVHLQEHRKMYHGRSDVFNDLIGERIDADALNRIRFLDFFRYSNISRSDLTAYLAARDTRFREPSDTGLCSTNCRANDIGIALHQAVRGYHNYAAPLSWEVRLGIVAREDALKQVDGQLNPDSVGSSFATLDYHPAISAAAVLLIHGAPVAFIVANFKLQEGLLQRYLASLLPAYMVPVRIHQLERLPLSENGKVDRDGLAEYDAKARPSNRLEPANDIESALIDVWSELFDEAPRTLMEDFRDAGGTSLKAALFAGAISEKLGIDLPLTAIFEYPTLAALAAQIQAHSTGPADVIVLKS